ncbi:DUF4359 domain-containing protein [Clostridium sp. YIM B02505]|uniref:DUF4359 domain-containing protein n=1 Tax=Clostridium yunnanense TaxID=2800325 RepID=A0ABS1EQ96_9CLOT|nr:DUF4359 domain-containing protein [Clostridium yunnanense]MBK1811527.1 DUF4359 domain-containing protein [Clostridium yunnanense]
MRKIGIVISIILVLLSIATFTNPTKGDYINWVKESSQKSHSLLEKGFIILLGDTVVNNTTTSNNFVIFSSYNTKIGSEKIKTIGAFNNFLTISDVDTEQASK